MDVPNPCLAVRISIRIKAQEKRTKWLALFPRWRSSHFSRDHPRASSGSASKDLMTIVCLQENWEQSSEESCRRNFATTPLRCWWAARPGPPSLPPPHIMGVHLSLGGLAAPPDPSVVLTHLPPSLDPSYPGIWGQRPQIPLWRRRRFAPRGRGDLRTLSSKSRLKGVRGAPASTSLHQAVQA